MCVTLSVPYKIPSKLGRMDGEASVEDPRGFALFDLHPTSFIYRIRCDAGDPVNLLFQGKCGFELELFEDGLRDLGVGGVVSFHVYSLRAYHCP